MAAAYAHPTVGRLDEARKIVKTLLLRKPEYSTFRSSGSRVTILSQRN